VTVNKLDIPEVAARRDELERAFRGHGLEPLFISAAGLTGLDEVIQRLAQALAEAPPPAQTEAAPAPVLRPRPEDHRGVTVTRENGVFRVLGERVVTFAEMMPVESEEGRAEVWRRLTRWGVVGQLRRAGAKRGDAVRIGGAELEFEP
jgi:GTP-binding protein